MNKGGKKLIIIILCLISSMSSCSNNIDNYSDIIELASFAKDQYDADKLEIGTILKKDDLDNIEKDSNISEIFSSDNYFYKVAMRDKNTVIIQKNIVFQSVDGYVVTSEESLDTYNKEGFKDPVLNIPIAFGYDGNIVVIERYIGEYDGFYMYKFNAGL